jgi:hypothetical protein
MDETQDLSALSECKKIYTNQLCKLLQPQIYKGISAVWGLCKNTDEALKNFQKKLEYIPQWNAMIINDEYKRVVDDTKCLYIDQLLDAVFIANAKILSVLNRRKQHLNITVPNPKNFLHACYRTCAYKFYSDPYLFDDRQSTDYRKRQKSLKEIMSIIHTSISETIENMLPMEDLLKTCLEKETEHEGSDSSDGGDNISRTNNEEANLDLVDNSDIHVKFDNSDIPHTPNDDKETFIKDLEETTEEEHPMLDILEGKNILDANKNINTDNLMITEEQMKKLDKEPSEKTETEKVDSDSDTYSNSDSDSDSHSNSDPFEEKQKVNLPVEDRNVNFFSDL